MKWLVMWEKSKGTYKFLTTKNGSSQTHDCSLTIKHEDIRHLWINHDKTTRTMVVYRFSNKFKIHGTYTSIYYMICTPQICLINVLPPNISTTIPNQCGRIVGDGSILGTAICSWTFKSAFCWVMFRCWWGKSNHVVITKKIKGDGSCR